DITGFQPLRDVDKVTVAMGAGNRAIAIAEARYDHFKVEQYLRDHNASTETYGGRVLYSPPDTTRMSLAFLDRSILGGDTDMLKQAIDRMAAPAPSALQNTALLDMVRTIETGNQIWVVGQTGANIATTLPIPMPPEVQDVFKSLTSGSYQMRISQDVHIKA